MPTGTGKVNATNGMKEFLRKHAYGESTNHAVTKTVGVRASSLDRVAVAQHFDHIQSKHSE